MYPALSNRMNTRSWRELGETHFPTRALNAKMIAAYVPHGTDIDAALVAPLYAALEGLPPALIQVGECDPLRDEGVAYAQALQHAGVEASARIYSDQVHGFIQFFKDTEHHPGGAKALDEGAAFLRSKLGAVAA
jgi:acetyl esterase